MDASFTTDGYAGTWNGGYTGNDCKDGKNLLCIGIPVTCIYLINFKIYNYFLFFNKVF